MKLLTPADNLLIATLWQQMLEAAGIRAVVRNRYLGAAVGELPADQVAPQVWLLDDRDDARARQLLGEWQRSAGLPTWCCFACGERVEGQFFQCWKCMTPRPA